jgi:hypothetical protein
VARAVFDKVLQARLSGLHTHWDWVCLVGVNKVHLAHHSTPQETHRQHNRCNCITACIGTSLPFQPHGLEAQLLVSVLELSHASHSLYKWQRLGVANC